MNIYICVCVHALNLFIIMHYFILYSQDRVCVILSSILNFRNMIGMINGVSLI